MLSVQDISVLYWLPLTQDSTHILVHSWASPGSLGGCVRWLAGQGQDQQPWPQERRGPWEPQGFTEFGWEWPGLTVDLLLQGGPVTDAPTKLRDLSVLGFALSTGANL